MIKKIGLFLKCLMGNDYFGYNWDGKFLILAIIIFTYLFYL